MPTVKKRVNLALSDEVYERLQKYREKNGISSDAGACVMLIVRQLDAIDESEQMMSMVSRFSKEELQQLSSFGLDLIMKASEKGNDKK